MFSIQSYFFGFRKRFTENLGIFFWGRGVDSRLVVCERTQSFDWYVQPLQVPRYIHVPASKQPLEVRSRSKIHSSNLEAV